MTMTLIWELSDFFNGLMFITNVLCLFLLAKHLEKP
jgi:Na+/alanine symporter